ncbi:hypothetical protein PRJBM_01137 [Bartonella henselae]|uniref:Uncharacterized protein n=1 Tax=Bartonella henselae (strain ATCC 49882 / DSM 28221 / CCUG 30454 / Houston 1) TaxID=283166 RepID=A0A0H3LXX2_BARHE|nr:hypothetical protein BhenCHDE101_05970 [Bartonella henselae]ETS08827.1 hypothetical protein Q655_01105 [Bartonella henselae JK 51]PNM38775.1 hypothetical protein AL470_005220 [Bartonella henselae str. Houston-1]CAF27961.1 hypothetical protein BH11780 [Bartonella henselae str. Houston-1]CDO40503.1 hypothetical protein PRJBM_01137 [Bartonella henselae]
MIPFIIKRVAAGSIIGLRALSAIDVFNVYLLSVKALIVAKCCYSLGGLYSVDNILILLRIDDEACILRHRKRTTSC